MPSRSVARLVSCGLIGLVASRPVPGRPAVAGEGPANNAPSGAILKKLEQKVSFDFAAPVPLRDLLKYVTLVSEGVPLKTSLRKALRPPGLAVSVKDGLLAIRKESATK